MKKVIIGSRESRLAVIQSELVRNFICENNNNQVTAELLTMKTTGDKILDRTLDKIGGKGLFVKELDKALIAGQTDISVHSLKDMPMEVPKELPVVAYSKREDPRDVLVLPKGGKELDLSKPIGSSSLRRILQLKRIYPAAEFKSIRGNVCSRLNKLDNGEYSAIVLAAAGLKRLGLEERISRYFTIEEMIPAAGQGILAVQGRFGENYDYLEGFHEKKAMYAALAERAFVGELNGGCSSPVAAHAVITEEKLQLFGLYYNEKNGDYLTGSICGVCSQAQKLGVELAHKLKTEYETREK